MTDLQRHTFCESCKKSPECDKTPLDPSGIGCDLYDTSLPDDWDVVINEDFCGEISMHKDAAAELLLVSPYKRAVYKLVSVEDL